MLHVARRLWRRRAPSCTCQARRARAARSVRWSACCLVSAGTAMCRASRFPARYFQFLRTGHAQPLQPVFEHNRLDLVSLAALTARALRLVEGSPRCGRAPRESYGLGRIFERVGALERAEACYRARRSRSPIDHGIWTMTWCAGKRCAPWRSRCRRAGRLRGGGVALGRDARLPRCPGRAAAGGHRGARHPPRASLARSGCRAFVCGALAGWTARLTTRPAGSRGLRERSSAGTCRSSGRCWCR